MPSAILTRLRADHGFDQSAKLKVWIDNRLAQGATGADGHIVAGR